MDYKIIPSTCSYCGCGCGVLFQVLDGRLEGNPAHENSSGKSGEAMHQGVEPP